VLYADDYAAEAWRHARTVWDSFQSGALVPDDVDSEVVVNRPMGSIAVRVDRVDDSGEQPRWVWVRSGQADDDDRRKERVMLYALAHRTLHDADGEVAIHYTATGEIRRATPDPKVLARHTAKIDALLEAMQAGHWSPTFGPHCDTCPFNLICPV
jgi:DNA helicase-2/ATP-dependent DNA helicase PcrA